ncbi:MAG: hypothetical protein KDA96_06370 [Planctomycetaceae bacterium]|nr:hypothetical protein [Planctomycetaceae bacterium]
MGLDMYLTGERRLPRDHSNTRRLIGELYDLGYWRKHPNLHGYIVQEFADGIDDCRSIDLDESAIQQILTAIQEEQLPHTIGFFFGESDGTEKEHDLAIFSDALAWLAETDEQAWRFVVYRASW